MGNDKQRYSSNEKRECAPMGGDGGTAGRRRQVYTFDLKRRAVRLRVEENIPAPLIARELGVSRKVIGGWVTAYRKYGEEALRPITYERGRGRPRIDPSVKTQIVTTKRSNPAFGVRRIAAMLRRVFLLPGSAETVRRTLHQAKLIAPTKRRSKRNPAKPRFFERATPNQMWQSDIFPFKLNGEYAYLIGFIDDHSRYITGLEVYRSQTGENIVEVYRRAVGEYGPPKEMLTDNGRQYASWHGKTRFQSELAKGRVHHIRSAPHHPQTLGKIERFWKTIWEEFLAQAKFESLETARERIKWWVQYYNHKRPNQGIGGACPADRYFRIQEAVREELERGIAANVREMALHGRPKSPFFVVGRVGEKTVVIRAENDQVKMTVDQVEQTQECGNEHGDRQGQEAAAGISGAGEGGGGIAAVGQAGECQRDLQGDGGLVGGAERVGETSFAGDAAGPGRAGDAGGAPRGAGAAAGKVADGNNGDKRDKEAAGDPGVKEPEHADEQHEIQRGGAVPGGVEHLERGAETGGGVPGNGDQRKPAGAVAGAGDDGDAGGADTAGGRGGYDTGDDLAAAPEAVVGAASGGEAAHAAAGEEVGEAGRAGA